MTDSTQPPGSNEGGEQGGQLPPSGGYQPPTYQPGEYGQAYGQQSGYGGYGPPQTNGLAIAAMVVGILALISFFTIFGGIVLGIVAVVLGAIGLSRANTMGGTGKGMAIAGIVTGLIGGLLAVLIVVGFVAAFDSVDFSNGGVTVDGTEFEFSTE